MTTWGHKYVGHDYFGHNNLGHNYLGISPETSRIIFFASSRSRCTSLNILFTTYIVMTCVITAFIPVAYMVLAALRLRCTSLNILFTTYIVMAFIVMAYIVTAYIVFWRRCVCAAPPSCSRPALQRCFVGVAWMSHGRCIGVAWMLHGW